jgi:hypothetical protein
VSKLSAKGDGYALDINTGRALPFTTSRSMYLALLIAAPNDATTMATMTEVTTTGYARQVATWSVPTGNPMFTSNITSIVFGPFSASTVLISWCALVSASTGNIGDLTMYWTLNNPESIAAGGILTIPASALIMMND